MGRFLKKKFFAQKIRASQCLTEVIFFYAGDFVLYFFFDK